MALASDRLTAVILAGGKGTRLRSVVSDRNKVAASVNGRPFLAYLLDQLATAGIGDVVFSTGYMGEHIRAEFGETFGSLRLRYFQENEPMGTGGALRDTCRGFGLERVLAMNGDSYCDVDFLQFQQWHREKNASASLVLANVSQVGRFGSVECDAGGRIAAFREKNASTESGWINAGIYLLEPAFLSTIPLSGPVSVERDVFSTWKSNGLFGFRTQGKFIDIGTPESYAQAAAFFTGEQRVQAQQAQQ